MSNREAAAAITAEREAFEKAMRQSWQMVDPLNPSGMPGSYARGEHNGICAALQTVRDKFERALSSVAAQPAASGVDAAKLIEEFEYAVLGRMSGVSPQERVERARNALSTALTGAAKE